MCRRDIAWTLLKNTKIIGQPSVILHIYRMTNFPSSKNDVRHIHRSTKFIRINCRLETGWQNLSQCRLGGQTCTSLKTCLVHRSVYMYTIYKPHHRVMCVWMYVLILFFLPSCWAFNWNYSRYKFRDIWKKKLVNVVYIITILMYLNMA